VCVRSVTAAGPYRWRLKPKAGDRLRLLAHRAIMTPVNVLGLLGGPHLSLLLQRLIGIPGFGGYCARVLSR
jgi:hypothetical protein